MMMMMKSRQQPGSFLSHKGGEGLYPLEPSTGCLLHFLQGSIYETFYKR